MRKAYFVMEDFDDYKKGDQITLNEEESSSPLKTKKIVHLLNAFKRGLVNGEKELADNTKVTQEHQGVPYIPKAKRKSLKEKLKGTLKKKKK